MATRDTLQFIGLNPTQICIIEYCKDTALATRGFRGYDELICCVMDSRIEGTGTKFRYDMAGNKTDSYSTWRAKALESGVVPLTTLILNGDPDGNRKICDSHLSMYDLMKENCKYICADCTG